MKNNQKFTGVVTLIAAPKTGTSAKGTNWTSQDIIIEETGEQYPQSIVVNFFGDKRDALAALRAGDAVTVHYNVEAKEYQGRWFGSNKGWKIEKGNGTAQSAPVQGTDQSQPVVEDDLPF